MSTLYQRMLPQAITNFVLPMMNMADDRDGPIPDHLLKYVRAVFPFPCIRIQEVQYRDDGARMSFDIVVRRLPNTDVQYAERVILRDGRVVHIPEDNDRLGRHSDDDDAGVPQAVLRLLAILNDRKFHFLEAPVSRQVRRSLGVEPSYREYIVIPPTDLRYTTALPRGEVLKRHPMLHAVRGHIRRLSGGRITTVRPHARGKGEALQVKDYYVHT